MTIPVEIKCKDYGQEGCLGTPDPAYTQRFDDLGEEPILFCSSCGEKAQKLWAILEAWMLEDPANIEKMKKALDATEAACKGHKS